MKKIKVLMVAGTMHVGGIENQLMHVARNIDQKKFQIDFTSTMSEAAYRQEIEQLGGEFILIPEFKYRPITYIRKMYSLIKENHYAVVHSHELFHTGITLFIAWLAGAPCRIAHAHNWRDDDGSGKRRSLVRSLYNIVMRWMINIFSTTQIACSTWAGEFVYGKKTLKKESYHLVFNSVDTSTYIDHYYDPVSGEFTDDKWINVLNVARITSVKNQIFLTEIAKVLKQRSSHIRILCAGSGDLDIVEKVKSNIKTYGIEDYMFLLGVRKDIDELLRKSRAFVLPTHYEGMPLVMIEAQASGLSCISADTYSREVDFGIDRVSWLSLDQSPEEWADAIEKAVMLPRAKKEVVEKIIADKKFDSRMFADSLSKIYIKDLKNHLRKHD